MMKSNVNLKKLVESPWCRGGLAMGVGAILLVLVVFYLPVFPYTLDGVGGRMGGDVEWAPLIPPEPLYPTTQPDRVPVYKVVDYVDIYRSTNWHFAHPTNPAPTPEEWKHYLTETLHREYQLPMPTETVIFMPYHINLFSEGGGNESGIVYAQELNGYRVNPSRLLAWFGPDGEKSRLDYVWIWVEKVGEVPVMSAHDAYQQLKRGNDISYNSLFGYDSGVRAPVPPAVWSRIPFDKTELRYYYPPAYTGSTLKGQYLIPIWWFDCDFITAYINAVDGSTDLEWTPENIPGFVPNDRFAQLNGIPPTRWIEGHFSQEYNVKRTVFDHMTRPSSILSSQQGPTVIYWPPGGTNYSNPNNDSNPTTRVTVQPTYTPDPTVPGDPLPGKNPQGPMDPYGLPGKNHSNPNNYSDPTTRDPLQPYSTPIPMLPWENPSSPIDPCPWS